MNEDRMRGTAERGRQMRVWAEGTGGLFEVFAAVEKDYLRSLVASDIADQAVREKIYHRLSALKDLEKVMRAVIVEGHGAEATIASFAKIEERKKQRKAKADV